MHAHDFVKYVPNRRPVRALFRRGRILPLNTRQQIFLYAFVECADVGLVSERPPIRVICDIDGLEVDVHLVEIDEEPYRLKEKTTSRFFHVDIASAVDKPRFSGKPVYCIH